MKKNIIFIMLLISVAAGIFLLLKQDSDRIKQAKLLHEKSNASVHESWIRYSKKNEFNSFVFDNYRPCLIGNYQNALICRSASVHLAMMLHGEEFAKRVNQSIVESVKEVSADQSISKEMELFYRGVIAGGE